MGALADRRRAEYDTAAKRLIRALLDEAGIDVDKTVVETSRGRRTIVVDAELGPCGLTLLVRPIRADGRLAGNTIRLISGSWQIANDQRQVR